MTKLLVFFWEFLTFFRVLVWSHKYKWDILEIVFDLLEFFLDSLLDLNLFLKNSDILQLNDHYEDFMGFSGTLKRILNRILG